MGVEDEAVVQPLDLRDQLRRRQLLEVDHVQQTGLADELRQEAFAEVALDAVGVAQQAASRQRPDHQRTRLFLALVDVEPAEDGREIARAVLDAVAQAELARGEVDAAAACPQRLHERERERRRPRQHFGHLVLAEHHLVGRGALAAIDDAGEIVLHGCRFRVARHRPGDVAALHQVELAIAIGPLDVLRTPEQLFGGVAEREQPGQVDRRAFAAERLLGDAAEPVGLRSHHAGDEILRGAFHHLDHRQAAHGRIAREQHAGVLGGDHALHQHIAGAGEVQVARHPRGLERRLDAGDRGFEAVAIDVDHRLEHAGEAVVGAVLARAGAADRELDVAEAPPDPAEFALARLNRRRRHPGHELRRQQDAVRHRQTGRAHLREAIGLVALVLEPRHILEGDGALRHAAAVEAFAQFRGTRRSPTAAAPPATPRW